jgi:hypothetical protein
MKKKILWILFAIVLCVNLLSCNKDDEYERRGNKGNSYSTYCWDFLYMGSVVYSQCDLTDSEADMVVNEMKKMGYTITKKRK